MCTIRNQFWCFLFFFPAAPRLLHHALCLNHPTPPFFSRQEFLEFLLDELHEDINRVQVKPYVETPDTAGLPLEDAARRCWSAFQEREDSPIVDGFQGQLRSHLTCPDCHGESTTFDPFRCLSLPLPQPTRTFFVWHIRPGNDGASDSPGERFQPSTVQYAVELRVGPSTTSEALALELARLMGTHSDQVEVAELRNGRFLRVLHAAWPWQPARSTLLKNVSHTSELVVFTVTARKDSFAAKDSVAATPTAAEKKELEPEEGDAACADERDGGPQDADKPTQHLTFLRVEQRAMTLPNPTCCSECGTDGAVDAGVTPSIGSSAPGNGPVKFAKAAAAAKPKAPLKRCGRCRQAAYCSTACQKENWPKHQQDCHRRLEKHQPAGVPLRLAVPREGLTARDLRAHIILAATGRPVPKGQAAAVTLAEIAPGRTLRGKAKFITAPKGETCLHLPETLDLALCWWIEEEEVANTEALRLTALPLTEIATTLHDSMKGRKAEVGCTAEGLGPLAAT
jgi:hypothetical protein